MSNQNTPASADASVMAKAESAATIPDVLDMTATVLIGIVGKPDELAALLRSPDGSIVKIGRGDKTSAGTVVGIDAESVSLQKSGKVLVLRLPRT